MQHGYDQPTGETEVNSDRSIEIRELEPGDLKTFEALMSMFGAAFGESEIYTESRPNPGYVQRLLRNESFIALVASDGDDVVGGLAAYELPKFEQARSEIYIYDLAVAESHRRQGIATALIRRIKAVGADRGAWVVFVQADRGDTPAIELYSKLGVREDVLHFDIAIDE